MSSNSLRKSTTKSPIFCEEKLPLVNPHFECYSNLSYSNITTKNMGDFADFVVYFEAVFQKVPTRVSGAWGKLFDEKTRGRKSRVGVPLKPFWIWLRINEENRLWNRRFLTQPRQFGSFGEIGCTVVLLTPLWHAHQYHWHRCDMNISIIETATALCKQLCRLNL
jgi:hypothetical protein